VVDEVPQQANVIEQTLGKGQTAADKARDSLAQRAVEALNVAGLTALLGDHLMTFRGQYTSVSLPLIGIEDRTLSIERWQRFPKRLCALAPP